MTIFDTVSSNIITFLLLLYRSRTFPNTIRCYTRVWEMAYILIFFNFSRYDDFNLTIDVNYICMYACRVRPMKIINIYDMHRNIPNSNDELFWKYQSTRMLFVCEYYNQILRLRMRIKNNSRKFLRQ